jgi:hypothetical protein
MVAVPDYSLTIIPMTPDNHNAPADTKLEIFYASITNRIIAAIEA